MNSLPSRLFAIAFAAGMARSPGRDTPPPSPSGSATPTVAAEQPRPGATDRPAPVSGRTDPFLQTLEHLRESFTVHPCAIAGYQRHWQRGFLG